MAGTLLFDGDCRFCTSSARFARRIGPRVEVVPYQRCDLAAFGVTEQECHEALQWVDGEQRAAGAAAVAQFLIAAARPWPLIGRVLRMPGVRRVAAFAYRLVATNRHRLPGGSAECRL